MPAHLRQRNRRRRHLEVQGYMTRRSSTFIAMFSLGKVGLSWGLFPSYVPAAGLKQLVGCGSIYHTWLFVEFDRRRWLDPDGTPTLVLTAHIFGCISATLYCCPCHVLCKCVPKISKTFNVITKLTYPSGVFYVRSLY
jgi:hypothetical protein